MARRETKIDLVKKYYKIGGLIFVIKQIKRSLYHRFRNIKIRKEYGEKKLSYGTLNPDKTVYIIRRVSSSGEGIGSTVKNALSDMMYADSKGYEMVVDQLNYYNYCLQEEKNKHKENAWEYYFEQPGNISLEEAYQSKNVILSAAMLNEHWMYPKDEWNFYFNKEYRQKIFVIKNKYLKFNPIYRQLYEAEKERFNQEYGNTRILGVSVRMSRNIQYSDYLNKKAPCYFTGAQVNPEWEDVKRDISEYMIKWRCDKVFFVDDTDTYIKDIKEEYKDKVVTGRKIIFSLDNIVNFEANNLHEIWGKDQFQAGIRDYILELIRLSFCNCILGGQNSTTTTALIFRGADYENEKIYDLGVYSEVR